MGYLLQLQSLPLIHSNSASWNLHTSLLLICSHISLSFFYLLPLCCSIHPKHGWSYPIHCQLLMFPSHVGMTNCVVYAICGMVSRCAIVVYNKWIYFICFSFHHLQYDAFEMWVAILCLPYIFWYSTCTTYVMKHYLTNHATELWGTMYYIVATTQHYGASDVHGLASSHGPGQARPGQSHGLTTALAWPEILESQSCWPRPWLLPNFSGLSGGFDKQFYTF